MRSKSEMRGYQTRTVKHIVEVKNSFVMLDMGLGKTISTLTAYHHLAFEELAINKALVIGPKRVAEKVWYDEIHEWEHVSRIKVSRIRGDKNQRLKAVHEQADVYTLGRDNVAWFVDLWMEDPEIFSGFDMLIIDESSSFKNPSSKRFKALKRVSYKFKKIVLLTGTPAPNGLMDLWAQMFLIDRGERLGKTITSYRETYFRHIPEAFKYIPLSGSEKKIHNLMADVAISLKAEDHLEMKEPIYNFIKIEMPQAARKAYDYFEKEQILQLKKDGATITALNAAALTTKLSQFANGAVYDEKRGVHLIHDEKLEALSELLEVGNPILLAWSFQHDRDRILNRFSKEYKIRELKDSKDIDDWNEGKIDMLMMHPASGGHGLNLQRGGHNIVWFGIPNNLELYMQLNARLDRQGQKEQVIINHLVMEYTLEADVVDLLNKKYTLQEAILQALKAKL